MRFPEFEMERMQSAWEHRVRYDLSESGVEPLTLAEASALLGTAVGDVRLGYADGRGREATRAAIAVVHDRASPEHVLLTSGTSEANFLAMTTLVDRGDDVVAVLSNHMQVHGLARGLQTEARSNLDVAEIAVREVRQVHPRAGFSDWPRHGRSPAPSSIRNAAAA